MKKITAFVSSLALAFAMLAPLGGPAVSAAGSNLVPNPGFETANGAAPASWSQDSWGNNTASFSYDTAGHSGRSASVTVSKYKTGDAKWYFAPVAVTANAKYTFSNWYKSTAATGIDAVVTTKSGGTNYVHLADPAASADWKQVSASFIAPKNAAKVTFYHYIDKNGTLSVDDYSLTDNGGTTTPPPANTPPQVSVTTPANNATVSNTVAVSANASDDKAVASVQFKLDGTNLGAADTTAPYSASWDTKTASNGTHKLTAVATDSDNASATAAEVTVTVNNQATTPPPATGNLIANPSVETANGSQPASWLSDGWGTNTRSFSYETNGQDGSRSLKTTVTKYTNGDAKWYFNPVTVTAGKTYNYSEWYKANVDSEVDAQVTMNDGSVQYFWLGSPAAASNWTKLSYSFTVPANAKNVTIFHVVSKVGYVQNDNFFFGEPSASASQFNRGLVSLTFDDGWRSIATNGLPLLKKYGLVSTQYLNSQPVVDGYPDYMTYQMVKDFKAQGSELAWHTRTHADITKITATQLNTELNIPAAFLTGTGTTAADFKNFASPYGAYNNTALDTVLKQYRSHRSTDVGFNGKDNFDIRNIKVQNIEATTTPADVQNWVNQAMANKTWLVIVYHEVDAAAEDPTYAVTPANLDAELNIVKQSGVTVKTVDQALDEVTAQL